MLSHIIMFVIGFIVGATTVICWALCATDDDHKNVDNNEDIYNGND